MFRRGFYVGVLVGVAGTLASGYLMLQGLILVGGENIAELGAKIHAFERRYQIQAEPVLGDYSQEQLTEPTQAEFRQMQKDRAAERANTKKVRPKA